MEHRLTITAKDIQRITNKSMKYAWRRMQLIRITLSKHKEAEVTIQEYCDYEGMKIEEVKTFLGIK